MTMPLTTHYDEEYLESYAMGRLQDESAAELEEHLLLCEQCQQRLERVDDFIRAFRIASNKAVSPVARPAHAPGWLAQWFGGAWRPLPMAGALAMTALAVVMVAPRGGGPSLLQNEVPQTATLSAMRGSPETAQVSAHRVLQLELDASGLDRSSYRVELADSRGRQLWQASLPVTPASSRISAAMPRRLSEGSYWLRLYDPDSGQLVREYGLRAQ